MMTDSPSTFASGAASGLSLGVVARQEAMAGVWEEAGRVMLYPVAADSWVSRALLEDHSLTKVQSIGGLRAVLEDPARETILVLAKAALDLEKLKKICEFAPLSKTVFYEVK